MITKEIDAMDRNEREFFSIWSDVVELNSVKLFVNRNFADDLLFNRVFEVKGSNLGKRIDEASSYLERLNTKPTFFVPQSKHRLANALSKKGFKHINNFNVMKLTKLATSKRRARIQTVDERSLAWWVDTYMKSFEIPVEFKPEVLKRSRRSLEDGRCRLYIGSVGQKKVGTILTLSEDCVTGFYCIGTIPEFRGKGIASHLLQIGIEDSKARGDDLQSLQNLESDKVRSFYEKRGFETVFVKKVYQKGSGPEGI